MRDRIPNTVRWFTTLAQHQHFAGALGPISMAAKPYGAAGAGTAEPASSSSSSRREGGGRKQKEGKQKGKEGKQKAALPNGAGPGEHSIRSKHRLWDAQLNRGSVLCLIASHASFCYTWEEWIACRSCTSLFARCLLCSFQDIGAPDLMTQEGLF